MVGHVVSRSDFWVEGWQDSGRLQVNYLNIPGYLCQPQVANISLTEEGTRKGYQLRSADSLPVLKEAKALRE
jgi:hypothetical protein